MFLTKLSHPRCTVSMCRTCYPTTPNGHDGAMSSLTGNIFKMDNFLMNLLSPKVPFVVFLSSCHVLVGEVEAWLGTALSSVGVWTLPVFLRSHQLGHLPRRLLSLCWEDYAALTLDHELCMSKCTGTAWGHIHSLQWGWWREGWSLWGDLDTWDRGALAPHAPQQHWVKAVGWWRKGWWSLWADLDPQDRGTLVL